MTSRLRWVFSTCALASVVLAAPAAQAPPDRPKSIRIYVTNKDITVDNGSATSSDRKKVWAQTGGNVAFVIENLDKVPHEVSIPISDFKPAKQYEKTGLATNIVPIVPAQKDRVTVNAGDVGVIMLRIQPMANFDFDKREPWKGERSKGDRSRGMTYKYNIYTLPSGAKNKIPLDPDIEIRTP